MYIRVKLSSVEMKYSVFIFNKIHVYMSWNAGSPYNLCVNEEV